MGGQKRVTVVGAGTTSVNGTMTYGGDYNSKPAFFNNSAGVISGVLSGTGIAVYWDTFFASWSIAIVTNGTVQVQYSSNSAVASPDLATGWITASGSNPVPTVISG
jgi:hypothetical protein